MHLLELHFAEDLLGAIQLHPHELVLRFKREELLEVRDGLLVPQRLEITCCPSTMIIRRVERTR